MTKEKLLDELLEIARRRRSMKDEHRQVRSDLKAEVDALDDREAVVVAQLDPLPLFDETTNREPTPEMPIKYRKCKACGESFTPAAWDGLGGKCPGCGK